MTFPVIVRSLPLVLAAVLCLGAAPAAAEKSGSASSAPASTSAASTSTASVPAVPAAAPPAATPHAGTVNINTGTAAEIGRLPRVGAKLADRIVTHRTQHGPFKRVEDLMEVKGVGEKMFVSLKPYLSVAGQTTLAAKVGAGKSAKGAKTAPASSKSTRSPRGGKSAAAPASR